MKRPHQVTLDEAIKVKKQGVTGRRVVKRADQCTAVFRGLDESCPDTACVRERGHRGMHQAKDGALFIDFSEGSDE